MELKREVGLSSTPSNDDASSWNLWSAKSDWLRLRFSFIQFRVLNDIMFKTLFRILTHNKYKIKLPFSFYVGNIPVIYLMIPLLNLIHMKWWFCKTIDIYTKPKEYKSDYVIKNSLNTKKNWNIETAEVT